MCLSVLISVYNTKFEYFKECIDSIENQIFNLSFEVIIVNDGSKIKNFKKYLDYTVKLNKNYRENKYIFINLLENKGIACALNIGLKYCKNNLIVRMDSDDIMKPNRLQLQYDYITKNKDVVLLGGQCELMNEKTKKIIYSTNHPKIINKTYLKKDPNKHWFINHPTVMFKKDIILKVGGYDEKLLGHSEDVHLWLKLIKKGYEIHNLSEIILTYRDCPNSLSHNFKYDIHKDIRKWIQNL